VIASAACGRREKNGGRQPEEGAQKNGGAPLKAKHRGKNVKIIWLRKKKLKREEVMPTNLRLKRTTRKKKGSERSSNNFRHNDDGANALHFEKSSQQEKPQGEGKIKAGRFYAQKKNNSSMALEGKEQKGKKTVSSKGKKTKAEPVRKGRCERGKSTKKERDKPNVVGPNLYLQHEKFA